MFLERAAREEGRGKPEVPPLRIAIVGAGLSGMVAMIALMRRVRHPFEAWLVDTGGTTPAAGLTGEPAGDLSVIPERPEDFADWLRRTVLADGIIAAIRDPQELHFPVGIFRDYVMARFAESLSMRKDIRIRTLCAGVRDFGHDGTMWHLRFNDGESGDYRHLIIMAPRERRPWMSPALCGLHLLGENEAGGYPPHFAFAQTVRQAYRAALDVCPQRFPDGAGRRYMK